MIALTVDVDTHDGMRVGVPRMLDAFKAHGVRATFFLALGPDRSGRAMLPVLRHPRFLLKMLGTGAPALYGLRTMLSGTVLPARPVATAFPELVRRIEAEGHEAAVHAWDHRAWQDELPTFKTARIIAHFERAIAAFQLLTKREPWGIRAPAWLTTPESLLLQDRYSFRYASDLRASPACRLMTPLGMTRLPQYPGSGACLEELLQRGRMGDRALGAALAVEVLSSCDVVPCATLHAEVEGGIFAGVLDHLLPRLRARATVVPMHEAVAGRTAPLPVRQWALRRLPGRAFVSSTSLALPSEDKHHGAVASFSPRSPLAMTAACSL